MNKITANKIIIKFLGDSGDGIQIIGNQISDSSVIMSGNDIYTFVDFPSEIRAPAGSIYGISGFQLAISSEKLYAVEDTVDLLVVLNPAALKLGIQSLKKDTTILIDSDSFNDKNLKRAGFNQNPLYEKNLNSYKIISIPITKLTFECVKNILPVISKAKKCKNFFILGIVCWIYDRKILNILNWIKKKFGETDIAFANQEALKKGYNYAENLDILKHQIHIPPSNLYKSKNVIKISGNKAFSLGAITSTFLIDIPLYSANYPITPASDVLHELVRYASEKIKILQLEDEIAAINSIIGASYGGSLALTCTSGPGFDLMQEGIGLSLMSELPTVLLNIQRSGPSTGIPTKSEQTDLLASIFGRHGESNVIVLSPESPSDCFWTIIESFILSILYLGPVIILSDANLANSSELWEIPEEIYIKKKFKLDLLKIKNSEYRGFYKKTSWFIPNQKNSLYCKGGLELDIESGNVSHDSLNHYKMIKHRKEKIEFIKKYFTPLNIIGEKKGDILIITWGSVCGIVKLIYKQIKNNDFLISMICLKYLNPIHNDLKKILPLFKKIIVIEENTGQLAFILKANFSINIISINQVTGKPFKSDILKKIILEKIYE